MDEDYTVQSINAFIVSSGLKLFMKRVKKQSSLHFIDAILFHSQVTWASCPDGSVKVT